MMCTIHKVHKENSLRKRERERWKRKRKKKKNIFKITKSVLHDVYHTLVHKVHKENSLRKILKFLNIYEGNIYACVYLFSTFNFVYIVQFSIFPYTRRRYFITLGILWSGASLRIV